MQTLKNKTMSTNKKKPTFQLPNLSLLKNSKQIYFDFFSSCSRKVWEIPPECLFHFSKHHTIKAISSSPPYLCDIGSWVPSLGLFLSLTDPFTRAILHVPNQLFSLNAYLSLSLTDRIKRLFIFLKDLET